MCFGIVGGFATLLLWSTRWPVKNLDKPKSLKNQYLFENAGSWSRVAYNGMQATVVRTSEPIHPALTQKYVGTRDFPNLKTRITIACCYNQCLSFFLNGCGCIRFVISFQNFFNVCLKFKIVNFFVICI